MVSWYNPNRAHLLSIENPRQTDADLCRGSYATDSIRRAFGHAFRVLTSSFWNGGDREGGRRDHKTLLSRIIKLPQEVVEFRQWVSAHWQVNRADDSDEDGDSDDGSDSDDDSDDDDSDDDDSDDDDSDDDDSDDDDSDDDDSDDGRYIKGGSGDGAKVEQGGVRLASDGNSNGNGDGNEGDPLGLRGG